MRSAILHIGALILTVGGATGCHATLTPGGTVRAEVIANMANGTRTQATQLSPFAIVRTGSAASATTMTYSADLSTDGATASTALNQRATVVYEPRLANGLRPYAGAAATYGETRSSDQAITTDAPLVPRATVGALRSFAASVDGGFRGDLSRLLQLTMGFHAEQSAGIGRFAATLPELGLVQAIARARQLVSRNKSRELFLSVAKRNDETGSRNLVAEAAASQTEQFGPLAALTIRTGAVAVQRLASPAPGSGTTLAGVAGADFRVTNRPRSNSMQLSVDTRPAFDRLDGVLRRQVQVRGALGLQVYGATTLRSALQWSGDVAGAGTLRQLLSVETVLRVPAGKSWTTEAGMRAFLQHDSGAVIADAKNEARFFVGWALQPGRR